MYECLSCNYKTHSKIYYDKHIKTKKHKKNINLASSLDIVNIQSKLNVVKQLEILTNDGMKKILHNQDIVTILQNDLENIKYIRILDYYKDIYIFIDNGGIGIINRYIGCICGYKYMSLLYNVYNINNCSFVGFYIGFILYSIYAYMFILPYAIVCGIVFSICTIRLKNYIIL